MIGRPLISIPGKLKQECLKPARATELDPASEERRGSGVGERGSEGRGRGSEGRGKKKKGNEV